MIRRAGAALTATVKAASAAALQAAPRAALAAALVAGLSGCGTWRLPDPHRSAANPTADPAPPREPAFELNIEAPAELRSLLAQHLDLARLADLPEGATLDAGERTRLIGAAAAQARELLQTEGYFEAVVTLPPEARSARRIAIVVQPGPRTLVGRLRILHQGELEQQRQAAAAPALALAAAVARELPLKPGAPFRNADWSSLKQQVLVRLREAGYATASIAGSHADVDVAARQADLLVVTDSGPLFRAGRLRIEGLQRHDDRVVRALAEHREGDALTDSLVLDLQERLSKAGLFDAVTVDFDPDPDRAASAALRVRVREQPLQQATVAVGVAADTGPRVALEHQHRRPFGWPVIARHKAEWGRDRQTLSSDLTTHPGPRFARWLLGAQIERDVGDTDQVLSQRLRLGRTEDTPRTDRLVFAEGLHSRRSVAGAVESATALSANAHLVWRDLDSLLLPTRGQSLALELALGQSSSDTEASGPFARAKVRATLYRPVGANWYLQARGELGGLFKRSAVGVPDALAFRAGGDDSVRGYAWRSLSPTEAGAQIGGHALATGSLELARPLRGLPTVWTAVFVDAGEAAANWNRLKPAFGTGVGLRWRSPVGPLRADLAWGARTRQLRLHVSAGVVF